MMKQITKRKIAFVTLIILVVFFVGSIVNEYLSPQSKINDVYALSDEKANSVDKNLVSSNTKFALNILKELSIEDKNKNIFISPLSISIALAMTYNGAKGTTKDAMARALQFGNMSLEEINQGYLNLIDSLENVDKQVQLGIADSVWIRDSFEPLVKQDFTQRVKDYFKSEIFARDFGSPQTPDEINAWISNKTNGKIDKMVDQIDPELVMFLINAIYFKGEWITSFNESATKEADFFLSDGSTVKVNMMSTKGNFSYYEGEDFKAARFPYGRDKIAMYIFLPNRDVTLDSFVESLDQKAWESYIDGFKLVEGLEVKFPKYKLEYGVKRLNDVLKRLGMGIAFSPGNANFTGIAPADLFIDYVDHKAVIEVNEKGTVAAAATVVGIGLTSMPPIKPTFFVDKTLVIIGY